MDELEAMLSSLNTPGRIERTLPLSLSPFKQQATFILTSLSLSLSPLRFSSVAVTFCHNDVQPMNCIFDKESNTVGFIE
jgi:thiamine kinase-like enzyme